MSKTNKGSGPDVVEFMIGLQDCIFGFGVALASAGIVSRAEIASAFEEILRQQKERAGCQHPARQMPVAAMITMFRAPTYTDEDRPC